MPYFFVLTGIYFAFVQYTTKLPNLSLSRSNVTCSNFSKYVEKMLFLFYFGQYLVEIIFCINIPKHFLFITRTQAFIYRKMYKNEEIFLLFCSLLDLMCNKKT